MQVFKITGHVSCITFFIRHIHICFIVESLASVKPARLVVILSLENMKYNIHSVLFYPGVCSNEAFFTRVSGEGQ